MIGTLVDALANPDSWIALLSLAAMEIVLGIDNIVFITILVGRLPPEQRGWVRQVGLIGALIMRLGLLFALSWIMRLTADVITVLGHGLSGRDLIMLGGGVFLIGKATHEIHNKLEGPDQHDQAGGRKAAAFGAVIVQIILLDIVFSLDSVITAVGMAQHLPVMVAAMVLAVGVMLVFAGPVGDFVERHPTMKMLALAFLILIGVMLVAEAFGKHIEKGYIYFAMAFSLLVELLNMRVRRGRAAPVHLHGRAEGEAPPSA